MASTEFSTVELEYHRKEDTVHESVSVLEDEEWTYYWTKTHPEKTDNEHSTLCQRGDFSIKLDEKVGGYVLTGCNEKANATGLTDGLHLVSVGGKQIVNENQLSKGDVLQIMDNCPKLWITVRPSDAHSEHPTFDKLGNLNGGWFKNELTEARQNLAGASRPLMNKAETQMRRVAELEQIVNDQAKDLAKFQEPFELPPMDLDRIKAMFASENKDTDERVVFILPGVAMQDAPGHDKEWMVGQCYMVLTENVETTKDGLEKTHRLFVVSQSNYDKQFSIEEHTVALQQKEQKVVTGSKGGVLKCCAGGSETTQIFPNSSATWISGNYKLSASSSESMEVFICEQQIVAARIQNEKSIDAILARLHHESESKFSETPPKQCCACCTSLCELFTECLGSMCPVGCCEKLWYYLTCGCCCKEDPVDATLPIRGWHGEGTGSWDAATEAEQERLFTSERTHRKGPSAEDDDVNVLEEGLLKEEPQKLRPMEELLIKTRVRQKIDIAYKKDCFSDAVKTFSFFLDPRATNEPAKFYVELTKCLMQSKLEMSTLVKGNSFFKKLDKKNGTEDTDRESFGFDFVEDEDEELSCCQKFCRCLCYVPKCCIRGTLRCCSSGKKKPCCCCNSGFCLNARPFI